MPTGTVTMKPFMRNTVQAICAASCFHLVAAEGQKLLTSNGLLPLMELPIDFERVAVIKMTAALLVLLTIYDPWTDFSSEYFCLLPLSGQLL